MNDHRAVPDYLLERFAAGDLPPQEATALAARVSAEELARLRTSDAQLLAALPPRQVALEVERRLRNAKRSRRAWAPALVAAATFALVGVVALRGSPESSERSKGGAELLAFAQTPSGPVLLRPGAAVRPGTLLQLHFRAEAPFAVIASFDGRGEVTLHSPQTADASTALDGLSLTLPQAYQLDDAPRFERFVLVTGDRPLEVNQVLRAAALVAHGPDAEHAPLPLPPALHQTDLLLRKEGP
jgi:hypothetical protein